MRSTKDRKKEKRMLDGTRTEIIVEYKKLRGSKSGGGGQI